jgi:hypothetical protein
MKIRNGFVSNSSSSSFVVATKGEFDKTDLVANVFQVGQESPFYDLACDIVNIFFRREPYSSKEEWMKEWCVVEDDMTACEKRIAKLFDEGWNVICDSVADYNVICSMDIHYKTDNIIIEKEGVNYEN